jgi:2'-5' RNA ligase
MDTFIAGDTLWPDGWTKLHLYVVPNLDEIKPLVDVYREVIDQFEFIAPVRDEWLHATVQMIDGRPAREVSPDQRAELEARLRDQLSQLPAFTVTAGGAVANRSSVVLDLTPDRDFTEIIHRSRTVIRDVLGDNAVKHSSSRPHITLGYARGPGDSGVVQSKLRNATDLRPTLTVTEVRLVDVTQDPVLHEYRWDDIARLPLGPGSSSRD